MPKNKKVDPLDLLHDDIDKVGNGTFKDDPVLNDFVRSTKKLIESRGVNCNEEFAGVLYLAAAAVPIALEDFHETCNLIIRSHVFDQLGVDPEIFFAMAEQRRNGGGDKKKMN